MWVFLNNSYLSIVKPIAADVPRLLRDKDLLLVRGRCKGDIERVFRGVRVTKTPARDYAFRAFVPRERVSECMAGWVMDINYTNFKDSVKENSRHDAYLDVWSAMHRFQAGFYDAGMQRKRFDHGSYFGEK
jgi:hypothetical protein